MSTYNSTSKKAEELINHEEILRTLDYAEANRDNLPLIRSLLERASDAKGLSYREAALLLACYAGCLLLAAAGTFITLAVTEKWGAGRTADAVMTLLTAVAAVFLTSSLVVFLGMLWLKVRLAWRLFWTGLYLALLGATLFVQALFCALAFNR